MKALVTAAAVMVSVAGGVSLLSAAETGEKQTCYAHYDAGGCQQVDCSEECPEWTELDAYCLNSVYSCKGYPPS